MAKIIKGKRVTITGGGGGGGFNPSQISDIFAWYQHDYFLKDSSGNVAGFADLSGNRNDACVDTVASRPAYITNQINGKPVARFLGTRKELITPPIGISLEDRSFSIIVVAKIPTIPDGTYKGVITNRPAGVSDRWFTFGVARYNIFLVNYRVQIEARHSTSGVTNQETTYVPENTFSIYSIVKTPSNVSVYRNGSNILSANINIGGGTDSTRPWRIGTWFADNQSLDGDIPFLAIYNKAIGATERADLEAYANDLYAIY